jgi:hypothetical protein
VARVADGSVHQSANAECRAGVSVPESVSKPDISQHSLRLEEEVQSRLRLSAPKKRQQLIPEIVARKSDILQQIIWPTEQVLQLAPLNVALDQVAHDAENAAKTLP